MGRKKPDQVSKSSLPSAAQLPSAALRLAEKLFVSNMEQREQFIAALRAQDGGKSVVIEVREQRRSPHLQLFDGVRQQWMPAWIQTPTSSIVPGKTEEHERGDWYLLDQSSVFCASPLSSISGSAPVALDLCASPGGKSVFLWRALQPRLLVANEPIQGRIRALISNVKRCQIDPCIIVRRDPVRIVEELPEFFDVVLVDAPCSGQSLSVKGKPTPGAFHHTTVNMCVRRQRRILAAAAQLVRTGGAMVYATCTYCREENEGMLEWFLKRHENWEAEVVPQLTGYQSHLSEVPCYRLWPFQDQGAGGFTCLLRCREALKSYTDRELSLPHIEWSSQRGTEVAQAQVGGRR